MRHYALSAMDEPDLSALSPALLATSLCYLRRGDVFVNDVDRALIFLLRAKLENLGVLFVDRHVAGFEVVDVAGFQDKSPSAVLMRTRPLRM